jgi:hypothetical protein
MTPTQVVDAYATQGYNAIAITEHTSEVNAVQWQASLSEAETEGLIKNVTIIPGIEILSQFPLKTGNVVWKHVLALFISNYVPYSYSTYRNNNVQLIFDMIHKTNGVGIVCHSWQLNDRIVSSATASPWWTFRNASYLDGWEIFNWGVGMNEDEIANVIGRGKIYIVAHDFSNQGTVPTQKYNLLFCTENTEAGIKDALMNQRIIAYYYGKVYGTLEALKLYSEYVLAQT